MILKSSNLTLTDCLNAYIKSNHLTKQDAAFEMEVSPTTLGKISNGKSVSKLVLGDIENFLVLEGFIEDAEWF